jgi:hypothetical protein
VASGVDRPRLRGILHLHILIEAETEIDGADDGQHQHRGDHGEFHAGAAGFGARPRQEPVETTDYAVASRTALDDATESHCTIFGEVEPIGLVPNVLQSTARLELPVNVSVLPMSWVHVDPLVEPPA